MIISMCSSPIRNTIALEFTKPYPYISLNYFPQNKRSFSERTPPILLDRHKNFPGTHLRAQHF